MSTSALFMRRNTINCGKLVDKEVFMVEKWAKNEQKSVQKAGEKLWLKISRLVEKWNCEAAKNWLNVKKRGFAQVLQALMNIYIHTENWQITTVAWRFCTVSTDNYYYYN